MPDHNRKLTLWKAGFGLAVAVLATASLFIWTSRAPAPSPEIPGVDSSPALKGLVTHAPKPIADIRFEDGDGRQRSLADFRGKTVLLNLWATWCAPCRKEMPMLDRLQQQLGSADFEVVALSIDREGPPIVKRFFDETNVRALSVYVDTTTEAGNKLGMIGLPTTLLIDREGREVARAIGPAQWDSPEIIETIRRYLAQPSAKSA